MAELVPGNKIVSTLASGISNVDTSLDVDTGDGALFTPVLDTALYGRLIIDPGGANEEIVWYQSVSGDTLGSLFRAAEAINGVQTAFSHSAGVEIKQVITKESMTAFLNDRVAGVANTSPSGFYMPDHRIGRAGTLGLNAGWSPSIDQWLNYVWGSSYWLSASATGLLLNQFPFNYLSDKAGSPLHLDAIGSPDPNRSGGSALAGPAINDTSTDGKCWYGDGDDGYGRAQNLDTVWGFNGADAFFLMVFVYPTARPSAGNKQTIFRIGDKAASGFALQIDENGKLGIDLPTVGSVGFSGTALSIDNWHCVIVQKSKVADEHWRIYLPFASFGADQTITSDDFPAAVADGQFLTAGVEDDGSKGFTGAISRPMWQSSNGQDPLQAFWDGLGNGQNDQEAGVALELGLLAFSTGQTPRLGMKVSDYPNDHFGGPTSWGLVTDRDLQLISRDSGTGLFGDWFGDGSDSSVTLKQTDAAPAWATKAGAGATTTFTLTRDVYFTDFVLDDSAGNFLVRTNGFRIFANGTMVVRAGCTIHNDGNAASGSTAGGNQNAGTVGTATGAGSAGGSAAQGGAVTAVTGSVSTSDTAATAHGGDGGNATGNGGTGGGRGGGNSSNAAANGVPRNPWDAWAMKFRGAATLFAGGAGGAGGTGGSGAVGGGGGGGGGIVWIAARFLQHWGTIRALGGNGADGVSGANAGGGGGGQGGAIVLIFRDPGELLFGALTVDGGNGGNFRGTGNLGESGDSGQVYTIALS